MAISFFSAMPAPGSVSALAVMPRRFSVMLPFLAFLLVVSCLPPLFSGLAPFIPAASRLSDELNAVFRYVDAARHNFGTASSKAANGSKGPGGTPTGRPAASSKVRDGFVETDTAKSGTTASGGSARANVRYWTRPNSFWTPPDLSDFPSDGIIPHKWRPRYNPKQYHLNSLMVVQFEWDRMGERWGYAPLGPWCGLCQTLNKGCRAECQKLCGVHCEGLGTKRFTDELGCFFCQQDKGYGCRKYAECQNNCTECAAYSPFVKQTNTTFAWGPLRRDLFGKESRAFPDKEADAPWTAWNNPITYDRNAVEL